MTGRPGSEQEPPATAPENLDTGDGASRDTRDIPATAIEGDDTTNDPIETQALEIAQLPYPLRIKARHGSDFFDKHVRLIDLGNGSQGHLFQESWEVPPKKPSEAVPPPSQEVRLDLSSEQQSEGDHLIREPKSAVEALYQMCEIFPSRNRSPYPVGRQQEFSQAAKQMWKLYSKELRDRPPSLETLTELCSKSVTKDGGLSTEQTAAMRSHFSSFPQRRGRQLLCAALKAALLCDEETFGSNRIFVRRVNDPDLEKEFEKLQYQGDTGLASGYNPRKAHCVRLFTGKGSFRTISSEECPEDDVNSATSLLEECSILRHPETGGHMLSKLFKVRVPNEWNGAGKSVKKARRIEKRKRVNNYLGRDHFSDKDVDTILDVWDNCDSVYWTTNQGSASDPVVVD